MNAAARADDMRAAAKHKEAARVAADAADVAGTAAINAVDLRAAAETSAASTAATLALTETDVATLERERLDSRTRLLRADIAAKQQAYDKAKEANDFEDGDPLKSELIQRRAELHDLLAAYHLAEDFNALPHEALPKA